VDEQRYPNASFVEPLEFSARGFDNIALQNGENAVGGTQSGSYPAMFLYCCLTRYCQHCKHVIVSGEPSFCCYC
jgi:hypothetical protein